MREDRLSQAIRLAQQQDERGFDALVEAYSARLYGYLYCLVGSRDLADDLLQEVFVRVVRRIGDYQHDGRFEAWLFRIAANLVRDEVRRARRRSAPGPGGGRETPEDGRRPPVDREDPRQAAPEARLEVSEEADRLLRALALLSSAEREVIMLRHFSGLSFREVADVMGTPVGTALARAHRGLEHLRKSMGSSDGR